MQSKFVPSVLFGGQFKDLDKYLVGFDEHIDNMMKLHGSITSNIPNYPPHNIRKIGDNRYVIELAVAGFCQNEIDIEIVGEKLIIKGSVANSDADEENFLFKGIANRAFTRTFALSDQIEVKGAEMLNGMLKICLDRLIPEEKKPKKVSIKTHGKQLLNEDLL